MVVAGIDEISNFELLKSLSEVIDYLNYMQMLYFELRLTLNIYVHFCSKINLTTLAGR